MKEKKKPDTAVILSAIMFFGLFVSFLWNNCKALSTYAQDYQAAKAVMSYANTKLVLRYAGLFSNIGYGMEGAAIESVALSEYQSFMHTKPAIINEAVFRDNAFYMMITLCAGSVFLKHLSKKKMILVNTAAYLLYTACIMLLYAILKLPLTFTGVKSFVLIGISLLSMLAFLSFTEMLLTVGKKKLIMTVVSLFLLAVFYFCGLMSNFNLLSPKTIPSFDYLYETDERFSDEAYSGKIYYDPEKQVMVVDEEEFAPEIVNNPDHATGIQSVLYYLMEIINPSTGVYLGAVVHSIEEDYSTVIPLTVTIPYILQACAWTVLSKIIIKRSEEKPVS